VLNPDRRIAATWLVPPPSCSESPSDWSHGTAPQEMSTDTAELATATGHAAAFSAATVTQHSKRGHDRSEPSRSLSIRAYAAASTYAGRLNGGVRGLFNNSRSPRLKSSPSDEFESFVLPHTPPAVFDKPPR